MYLEKFADLFNSYVLVFVLAIGLFTLLVDVSKLNKRQYVKEMKIARYISYFYIFGGLITYFALNIFR